MHKPILGVIGGIGSGKSLVAQVLADQGGHLISGDALGHEALEKEDIKAKIVKRWGADLLDSQGRIQRRKLGRVVFADAKELRALEALVFPYIGKRIREEIAKAADAMFIVLDAAVMLEAGWDGVCDKIIFVDAPEEARFWRLQAERGWSVEEIRSREKAQLPLSAKKKRADHVLENSGSPKDVADQVTRIVEEMTARGVR